MNQQIHPGPHLDADQLSTFVEGVARAREREQMLAHLAGCDACREMVFLLQGSVETPPDLGLALVGFVLLNVWRAPPLLVVIMGALGGVALAQLRA